ncbi:tyrosine-protein kinase-like otk [Toxorhynchites rutilus septentrionalis]|uniref:tyrosine-protein kinase-like otk n=1 Tax=Toxorhynchites rutilus septentrionalis TaxID=329112 RepID=UPI00247A265D|nr:tyrosine-protein kinase-like otk [Toxorhynchites rutilus septentrionalis]
MQAFVRGYQFQFTVVPKYIQVYEGESVVFKCRAFFDDEIDFSWTLNGNPIRLDHRVYSNGSNLHINSVSQRLDSGDYVCLATAKSSGARVATPPAMLDIILDLLDKSQKAFWYYYHISHISTVYVCVQIIVEYNKIMDIEEGNMQSISDDDILSCSSSILNTPQKEKKGDDADKTVSDSDDNNLQITIISKPPLEVATTLLRQDQKGTKLKSESIKPLSGAGKKRFKRFIESGITPDEARRLAMLPLVTPNSNPTKRYHNSDSSGDNPRPKKQGRVPGSKLSLDGGSVQHRLNPTRAKSPEQPQRTEGKDKPSYRDVINSVKDSSRVFVCLGGHRTSSSSSSSSSENSLPPFDVCSVAAIGEDVHEGSSSSLAPVVQLVKHESEKSGAVVLKCHVGGSNHGARNGSSNSGSFRDDDDIRIEWYRNDERLAKSAHIDFQRRKLYIKNATAKDNGVYSCLVLHRGQSSGLQQQEPVPSVKNYRLKLKATGFSDNAKIDCSKSQNTLLCRGKRGDKLIAAALTAPSAVPSSAAAAASAAAFTTADSLGFSTLVPVQIVDHPVNAVVNESASAIFNCGFQTLSNETAFVLRWRKDGKVIRKWDNGAADLDEGGGVTESSMFRDDARIYVDRNNGSLVFTSVIASDEGSYDCQVSNNGSEILVTSNSAELQIISNLRFTPKPPTSKNLELGSVTKIHCKAQGTPTPTVHWISERGGKTTDLPEAVEDVNGTLVFRTVTTDHRGNYTCVAANAQGEISATVAVTVVVAPKFEIAPQGSIQVAEMGTVFIHCVATGDPKPTIQWDKDLQYLHSTNQSEEERFRILENGTLVLMEVHLEDDGKYGCTIGNSAGLKREEVHLIVKPADSMPQPEETSEDGFLITRAVLITMSVAFAYIILVVGLMLWCRHRRAARKARLNMSEKENGDVDMKNCEIEPCLPEKEAKSSKSSSKKSGHQKTGSNGDGQDKSDDTVNSNKSKKSSSSSSYLDQLSVSRTSVIDMLQIGKCDFGDVYVGKIKENDCRTAVVKEEVLREPATGDEVVHASAEVALEDEKITKKPSNEELNEIKPENDYKLVMVKALTKVKDEHCCSEFRRQLDLFRTVSHKNVVKLFGLCRDKDPHYMLLEYTDWGDLKQFLLATSPNTPPNGSVETTDAAKPPPLKVPQILALAHQIGRGMDAIYKARIIHKDLATRNCIISSDFSAKITLPALSRDKYSKEYFKYKNQLMPVRWMAPECLQDDDFSIKSDIYSFAVLVWELFTQATSLPFKDLTDEEYLAQAQAGKLEWKVAEETPTELHKILISCWSLSPKERPSFSQLVVAIGNCLQSEYPKEPTEPAA